MNKAELIEAVAAEAGLTKTAAAQALDALTATIVKTVAKGDTVALVGFGTFKGAKREARTGRNPQTGEALQIDATTLPKFVPGAGFKSAVAGK